MRIPLIVKIEMPSAEAGSDNGVGAAGPLTARATSEDGEVEMDLPLTDKLLKRQKGYPRQYYHAELRGDSLKLGHYAPWQPW